MAATDLQLRIIIDADMLQIRLLFWDGKETNDNREHDFCNNKQYFMASHSIPEIIRLNQIKSLMYPNSYYLQTVKFDIFFFSTTILCYETNRGIEREKSVDKHKKETCNIYIFSLWITYIKSISMIKSNFFHSVEICRQPSYREEIIRRTIQNSEKFLVAIILKKSFMSSAYIF